MKSTNKFRCWKEETFVLSLTLQYVTKTKYKDSTDKPERNWFILPIHTSILHEYPSYRLSCSKGNGLPPIQRDELKSFHCPESPTDPGQTQVPSLHTFSHTWVQGVTIINMVPVCFRILRRPCCCLTCILTMSSIWAFISFVVIDEGIRRRKASWLSLAAMYIQLEVQLKCK